MNGKTKGNRKTGKKVIHRRKTANKTLPKVIKKDVQKMIKTEIARNVENKVTGNVSTSNSILSIDSGPNPVYNYLAFSPVDSGLLNINQGVDVQSRIGNKIKLKRWIIKGTVYYDPAGTTSGPHSFGQSQGYVDLYFGRTVNTDLNINNQLDFLYQNGSATITPTAQIVERTYGINRDYYKVYWHKRIKIGISGTSDYNNNDYVLNYEFGFDVCKHCTKNLVVKYDDGSSIPESGLLNSLYLFGTFTCPNTDPTVSPIAGSTAYSPVRIIATSYAEYEDA